MSADTIARLKITLDDVKPSEVPLTFRNNFAVCSFSARPETLTISTPRYV